MPFIKTGLPDLLVFEPRVFEDSRGYFFESYNEEVFKKEGVEVTFIQDNQARSGYGVIRGLHYQLNPYSQTKLIRVLSGTIWDVVLDMRKNSPTYGHTFSIELSAENKKQLLVPQGFAHGYSVLSELAEVFYKCDNFWNKEAEGGVLYNDASLEVNWKIPKEKEIISEKDKNQLPLSEISHNFIYQP